MKTQTRGDAGRAQEATLLSGSKLYLQLLVVFFINTLARQVLAEPFVAGWKDVRWGMSAQEISAKYPQVEKTGKVETYAFNRREYTCEMILKDITLAGYRFEARFLMDNSNKLAAVQIQNDFTNALEAGLAYDTIKEQVTKKYLPPAKEEEMGPPHFARGSKNCTWSDQNARVDVRCLVIPLNPTVRVSLAFQKPIQ